MDAVFTDLLTTTKAEDEADADEEVFVFLTRGTNTIITRWVLATTRLMPLKKC